MINFYKKLNVYKLSFIMFLTLMSGLAYAVTSPLPMLQSTATSMISELKKNQGRLQNNSQVVYTIVNRLLIPHVDQFTMARSVVPRNIWNSASPSARAQFMDEFKKLVIRTYSKALSQYSNESIEFKPIRNMNGNSVLVNSAIIRPGRSSIPVSYQLNFSGSQWKIIDFSVEGVSMVNSYRSQFASIANGQEGLAGLISKISKHNAR